MKISVSKLKIYLQGRSKEDLVKEITELFSKSKNVQDYYQAKLSINGTFEVLEKYKKIIRNEFFPERGFGKVRLSVARKAVTEFKKYSSSPFDIADIMIYYVEIGVDFTLEYGDIDEPFYNSMESMYEGALKFIELNGLKEQFKDRAKQIVTDTHGIGWGFPDGLGGTFYKCYGE